MKQLTKEVKNNVWSTKRVSSLLEEFNKTGVLPRENPFFMRKPDKKKADLVWEYTTDEVYRLAICQNNILEFAKECKVMTKEGKQKIKLRPYQIVALKKIKDNNFFIYLASRQIGKSIIIAIFVAWITTFFPDKACLLGSENLYKAKDLKSKIDVIIHNLPFYMQNGVVYFSTQRTIFDNGSKVISEPTTENFGVSGSFNVVYMDEFALLEADLQDKIIMHVVPTLDSFGDEARLIISTTPRGKNNKFYNLWTDALEGKNKFGTFKTKWYEVDGRDEAWKQEQIAIMGTEGFSQEYDLSFQADSSLLFDSDAQKKLDKSIEEYEDYDDISSEIIEKYVIPDRHNNITVRALSDYEKTNVKNDYEIPKELESYNLSKIFKPEKTEIEVNKGVIKLLKGFKLKYLNSKKRRFVVSIDLAGGVGSDYSVMNIFEIISYTKEEAILETTVMDESSFFKLKQVGIIRTNNLEIEDFAKFCYYFFCNYCSYNNFRIVLENNFEGGLFMKTLFEVNGENNILDPSEMMVDFPWDMDFEDAITYKTGIKQTNKTKERGAKNLKRYYIQNRIIINERRTVEEAQGFGRNKKNNYEGSTKNDDCIMTCVNISHYLMSDYFFDQIEEIFDYLDEDIQEIISKKIDNDKSSIEDYDDYDDYDMFED